MPSYQSPGVYVEEVPSGARPLEGVGHGDRRVRRPRRGGRVQHAHSGEQLDPVHELFGGFVAGSYLAQSVYAYFQNGGGNCYVVRIGQNGTTTGPAPRGARAKELAASPQAQIGRLKVIALDPAASPGDVTFEVTDPGGDNPARTCSASWSSCQGEVVEEHDRVTFGRGQAERRDQDQRRLEDRPGRRHR